MTDAEKVLVNILRQLTDAQYMLHRLAQDSGASEAMIKGRIATAKYNMKTACEEFDNLYKE